MNLSVFAFSLDIKETKSRLIIDLKREDTGRELVISLIDGFKPYEITKDCTAVFRGKKPDGTVLFNNCTICDNQIRYIITSQTVASLGEVACEITLYGSDGKKILSPGFSLMIINSLQSDEEIESTNEFTALTETMAGAKALVSDITEKLESGYFKGERGDHGVYIGSGEMPDGYNIQIDPSGEPTPVIKGPPGLSAYEIAVKNGTFNGTELEWLESLKGKTPVNGEDYNTHEEQEELKNEILTATKDEWIDLADITLEEAVGCIELDTDIDGNPFSVKKIVMKVDLPSTIPAKALYVGTKKGLWGSAYLAINVTTTALFICATIEVVEGKYTEIEMSQTKHNTYWGNISNAKVISDSSSLISQFYFGGTYSASMSECIPAGTTIKVWGLKV